MKRRAFLKGLATVPVVIAAPCVLTNPDKLPVAGSVYSTVPKEGSWYFDTSTSITVQYVQDASGEYKWRTVPA